MAWPQGLLDRLTRLGRETRGAVSIEFGMLAAPFLILLCAIMAAAMQLLAQQTLDDRLDDATRAVFTGVFQKGADPSQNPTDRIRALMCSGVTMFPCAQLKVEVTIGTTFSNPSARQPYDPNTGKMTDGFGTKFSCPTGDQIATIRAAVPIPSYFGLINVNGIRLGDGSNLLVSTAVFRTEPFTQATC
jgi:Flp pilus assembly pilin Flp